MGLPIELMVYAENLYRRFPEEFIALGMPGLEEAFDLRPNGTWSRRVLETPQEKTVEITIRRWPGGPGLGGARSMHPQMYAASPYAAALPPHPVPQPQAPWMNGYPSPSGPYPGQGMSYGSFPPPHHPPYVGATAGAAASNSSMEEQANRQLTRLESALATLKPQIEALLVAQAPRQMQVPAGASVPQAIAALAAAAAASAPTAAPAAAAPPATVAPAAAQPSQFQPQPRTQQAQAGQQSQQTSPQQPLQLPAAALSGGQGNAMAMVNGTAQPDAARSKSPTTGGRSEVTMSGLDNNDLLKRRQMMQLQIKTAPKAAAKAESKKNDVQATKMNDGDSEGQCSDDQAQAKNKAATEASASTASASKPAANNAASEAAAKASARQRAPVASIQTSRVPASAADPASPRSPGRYSVWN